jgi:TldD protein
MKRLTAGFTRRNFIQTSSVALAATALPLQFARAATPFEALLPVPSGPELKALAETAIAAASAAGATYVDVRIIHTRCENWIYFLGPQYPTPSRASSLGFGVRALVNGYWGFAGIDGTIATDMAATAGRDATNQAKSATTGKPRTIELAPTPAVTGRWTMPVEIDPFAISLEEKADYIDGFIDEIGQLRYGVGMTAFLYLLKQERTFVSSEGSYTVQTLYNTGADLRLSVPRDWMTERQGGRSADFLSKAGAGWEYVRNAPVRQEAWRMIEDALGSRRPKPVDVGRYDVVLDAKATANILGSSIGIATELDRAMGYEANGVGTSYLSDPLDMLGTYKVGSPLLNVTMNRSMPGGAATVKWDDEGVAPVETVLVKNGILNDFQTTREAASWISPYYQKIGKPVASNGCAGVYGATSAMQQHSPNLVMAPNAQDVSFAEMITSTKKGLAIVGGYHYADQQVLNGVSSGEIVYEITDGKIVGTVANAQLLYRSPEFWKNLAVLGGTSTVREFGMERYRDDYDNRTVQTVSCPAVKITGVAITDATRKA